VIAKADGDLAVPETQEANNLALAALQVGADLVISSVAAPSTAGRGPVDQRLRHHAERRRRRGGGERDALLSLGGRGDRRERHAARLSRRTGAGGRGQQQRLDAARDPGGHAARPRAT
jgi:hypothetical protein